MTDLRQGVSAAGHDVLNEAAKHGSFDFPASACDLILLAADTQLRQSRCAVHLRELAVTTAGRMLALAESLDRISQ